MLTTRFKIWLQDASAHPDWTGIELVESPRYLEGGCVELTVRGNGQDLRRLIVKRRDIFAAYLQMKPEKREER
jgi:hypothetical protein